GVFVFFFSSRRRHTRSYGDWSSDVCSSDLAGSGGDGRSDEVRGGGGTARVPRGTHPAEDVRDGQQPARGIGWKVERGGAPAVTRSEERRVGKEWRCRWERGG